MYSSSGAAARTASAAGRRKGQWKNVTCALLASRRTLLETAGIFLLSFVRWFQIPSPFAAAALLGCCRQPPALLLAGLGASLGLRLIWGLELDLWQFAGCVLLWLVLQKCRPRTLVETAVLAGLAMIPRMAYALSRGAMLPIAYSFAALPMAMLFAAVLRGGMEAAARTGAASSVGEKLCLLMWALLAVSGLSYFRVGNINLGQLAAVVCTAFMAALSHSLGGVAFGLMFGLALLMTGHPAGLVLPLSLTGLVCGLPGVNRKRWHLIPTVLTGNAAACLALFSLQSALGWQACVLGAVIGALIPASIRERVRPWLRGMENGDRSMENAFVSQRIAHMREAIENLARALPVNEEKLPSAGEELGGLLCTSCMNRELCWGRSREKTERMLSDMMEISSRGETIDETTLPVLETFGCLHAQEAAEAARDALVSRQRKQAARQKARYEREVTLTHLAALSGTLGELGAMSAGESYNDLRAAHVIGKAMEELRIAGRLMYARRVDGHLMAALDAQGMGKKALDSLLIHLQEAEELPLAVSRSERGRIELEEVPLYSASVGMASLCADGTSGGICGDACSAKRCEGGRLLMMLCDGMGHGEKAHRQSEKTIELLELLLEAGYTRHQAITAVNGMMMGAQEEQFSTVDLVDVDLWSGEVASEKLGACASWIVRGNHMKKIEGSSLPLGIVQEASPTASQYRLHSGDILLLMSDGVAEAFEEDAQFKKAVMDSLYIQPQRMADALLRNALLYCGGTPRDDMSVMVLLMMDRQRAARTRIE